MGVRLLATGPSLPLWPILLDHFAGAAGLDISSAFFTDAKGIAEVVGRRALRLRVVVSARYPTSPQALRDMCREPGADVRVAGADPGSTFHEKVYVARSADGSPMVAYLGSANWTGGGLLRNQEAGVLIHEPGLLAEIAEHFECTHSRAETLSPHHLASLEEEHVRQMNAAPSRSRDRGKMRRRWRAITGFMLKQNGLGSTPFREGEDYWGSLGIGRFTGGQTHRDVYRTYADGQGMLVSYIARRRSGRPDRLLYGRGVMKDIDRELWTLPRQLADWLIASDRKKDAEFLQSWPRITWLDPAEFIDYSGSSEDWVWASSVWGENSSRCSFQGGYTWLEGDEWRLANEALDGASERYGICAVETNGVWWNDYLGLQINDPWYMTRQRIEDLNT
jgi:hypothetical protein